MNYYELFSNKIHLHNTILQYIIYCYLLFKQNSILYRKKTITPSTCCFQEDLQ